MGKRDANEMEELALQDAPSIEEVDDDGDVQPVDTLMQRRQEERAIIIKEVRKRYPDIKLFSITLPYNGTFVVRPQEMGDVKVSSRAVEEFVQKKIDELGGPDKLKEMPELERAAKMREIDAEAADISNDIALKRCVVYPFEFASMLEAEEPGKGVPAGVVPLLLDRILEISGWQDVAVEEI